MDLIANVMGSTSNQLIVLFAIALESLKAFLSILKDAWNKSIWGYADHQEKMFRVSATMLFSTRNLGYLPLFPTLSGANTLNTSLIQREADHNLKTVRPTKTQLQDPLHFRRVYSASPLFQITVDAAHRQVLGVRL